MLNQQPPEKRVVSDGSVLSVHSIFHTIQGEGPFCGTPAVFVRLAGCNLQCPLCDTEYTTGRKEMDIERIVRMVTILAEGRTRLVVITGGEPFRQDLHKLIYELVNEEDFYVQVETNGSLDPTPNIRWNTQIAPRHGAYIVCSPKAGAVRPLIHDNACCYKYVGGAGNLSEDDGLPIYPLAHKSYPRVARPNNFKVPIYLQPTDHKDPERNAADLKAVIDSCMKHGHILQLQVHKIINME